MRHGLLALVTGGLGLLVLGVPTQAATATAPTVVSLTFDGTFGSQELAAAILSEHEMSGTFYVNSGYVDSPAHLSIGQLRTIGRGGHEIGGGSAYGNDLSTLTVDDAQRQVCDDRATLAQLGFQVTSFAYPYGTGTARAKKVVQECGYNSAREFAGLYRSPTDCSSCPVAETLPPTDDFRIRTSTDASVDRLKEQVRRAESGGAGWLPLTFTRVCTCSDAMAGTISPSDFVTFVTWLRARQDTTVVRTVDQVMGGPLKPVHGEPSDRLVPDPSPAISTPQALSKAPAWTVLGIDVGQSQILVLCVVVTFAIVVTFRLATKGQRHAL
ncbi:MAG: hypothetical protein EON53_09930 [Actinomycetales bacterium]|nr:MAG: hypothetical protein EON53_09930 [Actinomycetales bacterium]